MTRFDYAPSRFSNLRTALVELLDDPQVRTAVATLAAMFAVIGAAFAVELHRLSELQASLTVMNQRVAQAHDHVAHLETIRAELGRLRARNDAILDAEAASRDDVNALVALGNGLPADIWLTRVRGDGDRGWTIEGRATRAPAVGTALLASERIRPDAHARLLSVATTDPHGGAVRFTMAWERAPR